MTLRCRLLNIYGRFGGVYLHSQGSSRSVSKLIRNACISLPNFIAPHPITLESSSTHLENLVFYCVEMLLPYFVFLSQGVK